MAAGARDRSASGSEGGAEEGEGRTWDEGAVRVEVERARERKAEMRPDLWRVKSTGSIARIGREEGAAG